LLWLERCREKREAYRESDQPRGSAYEADHEPRKPEYAILRTTRVAYDYETRSTVQISAKLQRKLTRYVEASLKFRETG